MEIQGIYYSKNVRKINKYNNSLSFKRRDRKGVFQREETPVSPHWLSGRRPGQRMTTTTTTAAHSEQCIGGNRGTGSSHTWGKQTKQIQQQTWLILHVHAVLPYPEITLGKIRLKQRLKSLLLESYAEFTLAWRYIDRPSPKDKHQQVLN